MTGVNILYDRAVSTRGQPYHHGNLRPVLVETAVELARTTGPDGVVLREVARRAGVSHNAAYRHFEDRAALLSEVSDCAMADLEEAMQTRIDAVTLADPTARALARLRETGRAYVAFALREPGLFAVAFTISEGAAAHSVSGHPERPLRVCSTRCSTSSSTVAPWLPSAGSAPTSPVGRWSTASPT